MGLHYSHTDSGLILANEGQDEAAVRAALKDYDRELRLVPQLSESLGVTVWKVMRYAGSDRPADLVCVWQSAYGEPYPLSMGLLDKVRQLDRNTRSEWLDEDARNAARAEREAKGREEAIQDLAEDWASPHGRPVLPRSQGLRLARDRQRRRGKNI